MRHHSRPLTPLLPPLRQIFVSLIAADGSRQQLPATLVARDPSHELIVLQVTPPAGGLRPITAGSTAGVRVGQDALLLGALPGGDAYLSAGAWARRPQELHCRSVRWLPACS